MSLPFQNNKSRKYQCFVCGVQHDLFDEFTKHIKEKHEEGRDYVVCPLPRCGAAVRDVRTHFKARHPGQPVPPKGMMKASVWREVTPDGGIKTKKPKFREGFYESTKMKKSFHYRSGWEAKVYEYLDAWNEVIAYEVEPFEIPYIHEGEAHKYKPDLFIAFLDGHNEVWEVKPSNQTTLQKNKDKWFSARLACEARGWGFEVVTEILIEKLKNKVKNQHLQTFEEVEDPDMDAFDGLENQ